MTLLRAQFESGNRSPELRLQFADVLVQTGKAEDAIPVLIGVGRRAGRGIAGAGDRGPAPSERIAPGREDVVMRLATLGVAPVDDLSFASSSG